VPPAPAPAGGFSFGGATPATPAAKSPSTPTTSAPPAPVETPNTANKRAAATPTSPSTPAAAATSTPAPAAANPTPLQYQTLTVEQILNKFQKELETDALQYVEQAKRVCLYDATVRDSQRDLKHLATQTQRLLYEQQQVEQALQGVGAFQDQLEQTLSQVETNIDELFANQSHLAPQDADVERERAYQTASMIEHRLEELTESMSITTGHLNATNSKALQGEVGQTVEILNKHQNTYSGDCLSIFILISIS
jgi:hypothetical protein